MKELRIGEWRDFHVPYIAEPRTKNHHTKDAVSMATHGRAKEYDSGHRSLKLTCLPVSTCKQFTYELRFMNV